MLESVHSRIMLYTTGGQMSISKNCPNVTQNIMTIEESLEKEGGGVRIIRKKEYFHQRFFPQFERIDV